MPCVPLGVFILTPAPAAAARAAHRIGTEGGQRMATFVERMIGAARIDAATYEEVEGDQGATTQALGVVVLSSLAGGIGLGTGLEGLVVGTLGGILGWLVWSYLTYWIGAGWLAEAGTRATAGELMRTIGFASSPGILRVLGLVPVVREVVFVVTALWSLVAVVVAVRQALDYTSTLRAVGVCLLGWLIQVLVFVLLVRIVGEA